MLKTLSSLFSTLCFFAVIAIFVGIIVLWRFTSELPEIKQLSTYEPPVTTRFYAGDGQLLMEYANEKRIFVPENKIPDLLKKAFIAAEDQRFYNHGGIDYMGIGRAVLANLKNIGRGRRPTGASTITQQVAKNFLLSSELSYSRKLKEILLALRIERAFPKEHILELYLNEIYLGNRAYGVAAAALNYFNKSLDELELEEAAYLAALPKGPNNYNPKTRYDYAVARRNWVIDRMVIEGYVNETDAAVAKEKPLAVVMRSDEFVKDADYFSEEVRRRIKGNFGEEALYEGGLLVRTTLDPGLQAIATKVFRENVKEYDKRHGYRGAIANIEIGDDYAEQLKNVYIKSGADKGWKKAIVLEAAKEKAEIETVDGEKGVIPLALLQWAKPNLLKQAVGNVPGSVAQVVKKGDVILVEKASESVIASKKLKENSYELRQIPNVEGGMIVMDPHTGRVLATVGGYDFRKSQFNRATQARRQTGSVFKPVVYLTALENGYSPTDLILDAPFVLDQGPGLPKWKPVNYSKKFYGLMTLRQGLEKSRNLMTVRLARDVGMTKVSNMTKILGVNDNLPSFLSMSLGAGDTRLIDISSAYAVMVNGGKKIKPYFIERVQDRNGKTIFKEDGRECADCVSEYWNGQDIPDVEDNREQIVDPLSAYQMTYMLEGVATRGTGAGLRGLNRHLAGKTGTTNDNKDSWFIGFSPDLVVGIYFGFDEPRTLGRSETGAVTALPVFNDFMKEALKGQPDIPFRTPSGIKFVRINYDTGKPATPFDKVVILEALKPDIDSVKTQKIISGEEAVEEEPEAANENKEKAIYFSDEDDLFQLGTEY
ncbi:MAG: penicillin-binding protein 1A [Lactobacillaceae bacterium]|jgi:penicillin-binding protein 1A|nr:penicillin-binding protein 1A [Lactobacillaceae bacterium]